MDTQGISEIEQRRKEPKHTFRHIGFQNEEQSDEIFIFNLLQIKDARRSYIHLEIEIWLKIIHKQSTSRSIGQEKTLLESSHRFKSINQRKHHHMLLVDINCFQKQNQKPLFSEIFSLSKVVEFLYLNKIFYTIFLVAWLKV